MDFQRQTALVTGASSGIGRAIALALGREGVGLFLAARGIDALQETERTLRERSGDARGWICPTDLSSQIDIDRLRATVESEVGYLDILVHCGGAFTQAPLDQADASDFDRLYETNLRGPFLLTNALLPLLRRRQGQIVFVNSSVGVNAPAGSGQFAATQHALRALANVVREEINSEGIRVLNLYLGRTATPRMRARYEREGKEYRPELLMQVEDVASMTLAALKLPRTAEVTEIHMRPLIRSY